MYKVFFNDRIIHIVHPGKITFRKSSINFDVSTDEKEILKWFLEFSESDIDEVFIEVSEPDKFLKRSFRKAFVKIKAAGGIVRRNNSFLFIYRNKKWDLPKGKIDKGESPDEAAIREVQEECGLSGHRIVKPLPITYHIFQSTYPKTKGDWIFKETHWFEMEYNGTQKGIPQLDEDIEQVVWFEKSKLSETLTNTYANLKSLIGLYLA